jgi:O-antigen/teichoic acid export membrane protein
MAVGETVIVDNDTLIRGRNTAKTATLIMIAKVTSFIIAGIYFVILARVLTPSIYGIYAIALATAGIFGAFGDFGIGSALVKRVSEHLAKRSLKMASEVVTSGLFLLVLLPGVFTIAAALLGGPIALYVLKNPIYALPLELASLTIVGSALYGDISSALIGFNKPKRLTEITMLQVTLQAGVSIALIFAGLGALAPIYGILVSYFVGFIAALAIIVFECKVRLNFTGLNMDNVRGLFRFSLPLGLSGAAHSIVTNVAVILLGAVASSAVVGNFGIAVRMAGMFDIIVGTINLALLPLFSSALAKKTDRKTISTYFNYSLYVAFLLIAPVVVYIAVLANQVIITLFSGLYSLAPQYVTIMAAGILLSVVSSYATTLFVGMGDTRKVMKYGLIVVLVDILLLPVLLPLLGGIGLSIVVFIVEPIVANILYLKFLGTKLDIKLQAGKLARVVLAAVVSAAFIVPLILLFPTDSIAVLIVAAVEQIALYPIAVSLLGGVTRKDIRTIRLVSDELPVLGKIVDVFGLYMGYVMDVAGSKINQKEI